MYHRHVSPSFAYLITKKERKKERKKFNNDKKASTYTSRYNNDTSPSRHFPPRISLDK